VNAELLAEDLVWPEGPAALDDGSVAFVETYRSQVSIWSPGKGVRRLADTGGGPNAVCLGSDERLYVTQNGGIVGDWRADELRPGSIQRVSLDGTVETIATEVDGIPLRMPNDLAFGPDGRLYFTDPGLWDLERRPDPGYVFALDADGSGELIAELPPVFPNGIAVEADGGVVWVETYTRRVCRCRPGGGARELLTEFDDPRALPDGLAVAADGSLYIAVLFAGGLRIVGPDGSDRGRLDVGAVPSNCTFSGRALYVTDGGSELGAKGSLAPVGRLWRAELDVPGLTPFRGRVG
jgi:gluconolactonase